MTINHACVVLAGISLWAEQRRTDIGVFGIWVMDRSGTRHTHDIDTRSDT
jgi:hypothetical protein